jgi:hypothetical protein
MTSFVLDGDCKPVTRAHQAFRDAMLAGDDTKESAAELQKAITDNSEALMKFAGIEAAPAGGEGGANPTDGADATEGAPGVGGQGSE